MGITANERQVSAFLALGCVGFISSPVLAQDAGGAGEPARLGGMTVTDTAIDEQGYKIDKPESPKYTAPLLDTPKSVVVLPAQVMKETGSTTLVEALRTVPGITFGAGEGGNPQGDRPFIRGFDTQGSTYIDGIRSVGGQSREVFAIEQIEVVRGGDSTLGGRGSAGGSLNMVTKKAHLGTEVAADLSYGTHDYKRATVDANYQLSDVAAVRINAMWHDQDVAKRDAVTYNRWGFAPSIGFGLDTSTRAFINYYHLETDDLPDAGTPFERTQAQAVASGNLHIRPAEVVNGQKVKRSNFYGLKDRDFRKTNIDEIMLRVEHDVNDAITIRNTAKYANVKQAYIITQPDDSQGNVQNGQVWRRTNSRYGGTDSLVDQLDISAKFNTGTIEHSLAAGIEGSWERSKQGTYGDGNGTALNTSPRCTAQGIAFGNCTSLFNPNPNDPWVNRDAAGNPIATLRNPLSTIVEINTRSVYLLDTITVTEALLVNLGVRYDHYDTKARSLTNRTEAKRTDDLFNWQAGVVYKPASNGSVYASYATSATPPGSFLGEGSEGNSLTPGRNDGDYDPDDLKVEKTKSYEIGTKWEFFDSALGVNLALFRTETKNARTTGADGLPVFVGERRIDGVEVSVNGQLTENWSVFGGYTYMDSEVKFAGENNAANGKPFPNTPEHSFTLWTTYDFADRFEIGGGAIYNSKQYGNFGADGVSRSIPGYWRFDATASVDLTDYATLRVNVQNLFNKKYYDRTYGTHFATMAPGRSAFATLGLKF